MRRIAMLALLIGCGGATSKPAASRPPPTEADACERICSVYDGCNISPPNCTAGCAAEQQRLREGVEPSLAACLERELDHCELRAVTERRQILSICFAAVVEAYGKDETAVNKIVTAVCAQQDRCATEAEPADPECRATLRAKLKYRPLSIVRAELLDTISACIEKSSCNEPDPVGTCAKEAS